MIHPVSCNHQQLKHQHRLKKRAKACVDYLMAKGVDSSRISFESFGACCPVEMELINGRDNADGRAKNRRGLINISYPPKEEE